MNRWHTLGDLSIKKICSKHNYYVNLLFKKIHTAYLNRTCVDGLVKTIKSTLFSTCYEENRFIKHFANS